MDHKGYMDLLRDTQHKVEKLLFEVRMHSGEGRNIFEPWANNLADKIFILREVKEIKLVSLRKRANELIKQAAQLHADYFRHLHQSK